MRRAPAFFVLWLSITLGGCAAKHERSVIHDAGVVRDATSAEPDTGVDAAVDATLADAALVDAMLSDAGIDASDGAVLTECDRQFNALNDSCQVNEDCAVVWQLSCVSPYSRVLGVARGELGQAQALAQECGPRNGSDCGFEGYLAPLRTDDGQLSSWGLAETAVRCDRNRCVTYLSACGPRFCGNGTADECYSVSSGIGNELVPRDDDVVIDGGNVAFKTEDCDGTHLNGESCESIGYGSGVLSCAPLACRFDEALCRSCRPTAGIVTACIEDAGGSFEDRVDSAIAVSDSATILAWARNDNRPPVVELALFDTSLAQTTRRTLTQDVLGRAALDIGDAVLLAPRPGGWLLALVTATVSGRVLQLHALRADGSHERAIGSIQGASVVQLVPRAGATPWIVSTSGVWMTSIHVHRLDPSLTLSAPIVVGTTPLHDSAWTGAALLVAFGDPDGDGLQVQRVEHDGSVVSPARVHGTRRFDAWMTATGQGAVLGYRAEQAMLMVELDADGAAATTPVPIPTGILQSVAWGDGLMVARAVDWGSLSVSRLALDGTLSATAEVARHPGGPHAIALVPQAQHLVLGIARASSSVGPSLQLARIDP